MLETDMLVGLEEIVQMASTDAKEVPKQTAHAWTKRPSFPKPMAYLACGRIWDKAEVTDWITTNIIFGGK